MSICFLIRNFYIEYELSNMKVSLWSCILSIKNLFFCHLNSCTDVAIGAPQEDDLRGAIYIYNGRADGVSPTFSQVGCYSVFKRSIDDKQFLKLPLLIWTYFYEFPLSST